MGSGGINPCILNLDNKYKEVSKSTSCSRHFSPWKEPRYTLDMMVGGLQTPMDFFLFRVECNRANYYWSHYSLIISAPNDDGWWWVWEMECFAGETEVLGESLPQCRVVHHKSHVTRPGPKPGPPATDRLSYGTALWRTSAWTWWRRELLCSVVWNRSLIFMTATQLITLTEPWQLSYVKYCVTANQSARVFAHAH
jgi:hypothetical protein